MNKSFQCKKCPKAFKLNFHMNRHELSCTGFQSYVTCSDCGDLFKSERTLKSHKLICTPNKSYICDFCDNSFVDYSLLKKHKDVSHKKIMCEICDSVINYKNIRKHKNNVHKNETPATAAAARMKKNDISGKYKCDVCNKYFFDKSTLNRHKKTHMYSCEQCEKTFQNNDTFAKHELIHTQTQVYLCEQFGKKFQSQDVIEKQTVMHKKTIKEDNFNLKVELTAEDIELILDVHKHIEGLLAIVTNRGQSMEWSDLKSHAEKNMKRNFTDEIFSATISVVPEAYSLYLFNNIIYIQLVSNNLFINPKILEERKNNFKDSIRQLHQKERRV